MTTHIGIRRFELFFLKPLSALLPVLAGFYFFQRAWVAGIVTLALWFVVGAIGQALPHRKQQSIAELSKAAAATFHGGDILHDEALVLGRAVSRTAYTVMALVILITWHQGVRWYWIILAALGARVLFVIAPLFLYRKPRDESFRTAGGT